MQNLGVMCCREGVGDARQYFHDLSPRAVWHRSAVVRHPVGECAAVGELRDDVFAPVVLPDFVHRENVRMVERARRLRFALKTSARGCIDEVLGKEFDRDRPLELGIDCAVDDSDTAGTQLRFDAIVSDAFTDEPGARICRRLTDDGYVLGREQRLHGNAQVGIVRRSVVEESHAPWSSGCSSVARYSSAIACCLSLLTWVRAGVRFAIEDSRPRPEVRQRRADLERAEVRRPPAKSLRDVGQHGPASTAAEPGLNLKSKSSALYSFCTVATSCASSRGTFTKTS